MVDGCRTEFAARGGALRARLEDFMTQGRLLQACLLLAAIVAGCGGDDKTSSAPQPPEPRTSAADTRVARASLLQLSDLPNGWTAVDEDEDEDRANSRCPAVVAARTESSARERAATFQMGDAPQVLHGVFVFATAVDAQRMYARLASTSNRKCLGRELADAIKDGANPDVKFGDTSTGLLRIDPVGEEVTALRIGLGAESKGINVPITIDLAIMRQGRVLSQLVTFDYLTQFDDELRGTLLAAIEQRATKAQKPA
jgi:hypothetical protein